MMELHGIVATTEALPFVSQNLCSMDRQTLQITQAFYTHTTRKYI